MEKLKNWWRHIPSSIRKPLVFMIGFAIVAAGIAMLALPGPGWAAIFLGFAILATEFAFAERVRDWLVSQLKMVIAWLERRWKAVRRKNKKSSDSTSKPPKTTKKSS